MIQKITRDAFLYLDPRGVKDDFAQCSTCTQFRSAKHRCAILGPTVEVNADDSCGFYLPGTETKQPIAAIVSPEEVGLVHRRVRCENCRYFNGKCRLFVKLNQAYPRVFDLDPNVHPQGCCNAQTPSARR